MEFEPKTSVQIFFSISERVLEGDAALKCRRVALAEVTTFPFFSARRSSISRSWWNK